MELAKNISQRLLSNPNWRIRAQLAETISNYFDELSDILTISVLSELLSDADDRVIFPAVSGFIINYHLFNENKRKILLKNLAEKRDGDISNHLCLIIFDEWKKEKMNCSEEIFEILLSSSIEIRYRLAYYSMRYVKDQSIKTVFRNTILTDLIIRENYKYGPFCITIYNLYDRDPQFFDELIPVLMNETDYRIRDRLSPHSAV